MSFFFFPVSLFFFFVLCLSFFSLSINESVAGVRTMCAVLACRIKYDGMAFHCLLSLLASIFAIVVVFFYIRVFAKIRF